MPLVYFGTMISASIMLNQPEHQDQPGMETAIDSDDSHHPSCWTDWQASFYRFTRQDTSLCLGCNPPSPLWVLKTWQVNSASCHSPFFSTPQPLADAQYKGQLAGSWKGDSCGRGSTDTKDSASMVDCPLKNAEELPCIWGFLHDTSQDYRCATCNMAELRRKDWRPTKHFSSKHSGERKVFCDFKALQVNTPWDELHTVFLI